MNDDLIIQKIKKIGKGKSVITSFGKGFDLDYMQSYQGGSGMGYMGSSSVLQVKFNKKESAQRLKNKIDNIKW